MPIRANQPFKKKIDNPVPIIPTEKHIQDIKELLCISFSTNFPANAADIPKKKIANENAHPTAKGDISI